MALFLTFSLMKAGSLSDIKKGFLAASSSYSKIERGKRFYWSIR
jgi:hypothetical protein